MYDVLVENRNITKLMSHSLNVKCSIIACELLLRRVTDAMSYNSIVHVCLPYAGISNTNIAVAQTKNRG